MDSVAIRTNKTKAIITFWYYKSELIRTAVRAKIQNGDLGL